MFDKILGKKQKGIQIFNIPQKRYCYDQKKLAKMQKKDLNEVINDMQKYIASLCQKLELGKKQFQRSQQRCEQVIEKSNVLNGQMSRINNQHQELQVKFMNLQNSLQMTVQQRQSILEAQILYIQQKGWCRQKIKDLYKVFQIYHSQLSMSDKVLQQNKQLKQKLTQLQTQYHDLSQKYSQIKAKSIHNQNIMYVQQAKSAQQQLLQQSRQIPSECKQCLIFKNVLQGKQQIITSLNKQIKAQKQKLQQNSYKIQQLHQDLEHVLSKIPLKDEQLVKYRKQNNQLINSVNQYKKNQLKYKQHLQKYKQQNITYRNNIKTLEVDLALLKSKYQPIEQLNHKLNKQLQKQRNEVEKKQIQIQNFHQKLMSYEEEINNLSKLNIEIKLRENQIGNLRSQMEKQKNKYEELKKLMQAQQEEYLFKFKKMEVAINQERIKADAMKRHVTNLEAKDQQNRKNLDDMYQNKIQQDGKIVQMEKKLKDYKHQIQYLKKQKNQMQKTFQSKIKNMEEMVIYQVEDDEEIKQTGKEMPYITASPRIYANSIQDYQKQNIKYQKKIAQLQEQLDMLKQENMNIKLEKSHFQQQSIVLQSNLKSLASKRQQMLRQINKLSSMKNIQNHQKTTAKQMPKQANQQIKTRDKRIAEKAYKGFDILAKLLSALYKAFLGLHLSNIHLKQVKQIQSSINQIVRKSLDMKDIFQDYI